MGEGREGELGKQFWGIGRESHPLFLKGLDKLHFKTQKSVEEDGGEKVRIGYNMEE